MKAYLFILTAILSLLLFNFFLQNYLNKNIIDNIEKDEANKTDEASIIIATDKSIETDKTPETDIITETDVITETDKITNKEEQSKDDSDPHYFTALYKTVKGRRIKAFNTYGISVNDSKYFISYFPISYDSEGRRLEENDNLEINLTDVANGYFNSPEDGLVRIRVTFSDSLPSLNFLFEGCEDLINIDLSQINSPNITRLSYAFNGCTNLERVNLTSVDISNVEEMEFLFSGCSNLVDVIGLENLNTTSLRKATGMFFNCNNLQIANLSSFDLDNVEEPYGIFVNTPSLQIVDLGNCTDANYIFNPNEEYNIIIIGNDSINTSLLSGNIEIFNNNDTSNLTELIENLNCIIGLDDKCFSCNDERGKTNLCSECNFGYYLPLGLEFSQTKCKKCEEGCELCHAANDSDLSICDYCVWNYNLYDGKCIKYCEVGSNEKCFECKSELEGKNDECESCNEGYYLDPNYNKSVCIKGEVEHCINFSSSNFSECLDCAEGYMLHENQCYKTCKLINKYYQGCETCNPLFEYRHFCESCSGGMYLPNGASSTECYNCPIYEGCMLCELIAGEMYCKSCYGNYELINGKCFKICEYGCSDCYYDGKTDGNCLKCEDNYYLDINYVDFDTDYLYPYDYYNENNFTNNISNTHYICRPCPWGCKTCYDPENGSGYYTNKLKCTSCESTHKLVNGSCLYQCYTGSNQYCLTCDNNITDRCATCNPYYYLNKTTGQCISCGINNCTICNDKKECLECDINYELENNKCTKICEIGLEENCKECNNNIGHKEECLTCNEGYFLPEDSKKKCKKCPVGCTSCFGTTDEITCSSCHSCRILSNGKCQLLDLSELNELCLTCDFEESSAPHCRNCIEGAYYNTKQKKCLVCGPNIKLCHEKNDQIIIDKCNDEYVISGDKCLKECEKGNFHKCLSCKTTPGEVNQCKECNKGFFLPSDSSNKEECNECPEGCLKCSGTINNIICSECSEDYMLYEGQCIRNCNKGSEEKCRECNQNPGSNNRCSKCNEGYYLPDYSTDLDYNYICKKCPTYCLSCYGDYNKPICTKCDYRYVLKNGECKEGCYFLNMRNCLTCDDSGDFPICSLCREGYYFPSNKDKFYDRCFKCSIPGCNKCEGENEYSDKCIECESIYTPIVNDGIIQSCIKMCDIGTSNKCQSCSQEIGKCGTCNDGFELNGGMCYIKDFDIEAEYVTLRENELVKLMNCVSEFLEIDGINMSEYPSNYVYMEKPGVHKVKMKLSPYCSFPSLFNDNPFLKSIKFCDHFDSKRITLMNDCFCDCPNLESVDLSNLDLSNNLYEFF